MRLIWGQGGEVEWGCNFLLFLPVMMEEQQGWPQVVKRGMRMVSIYGKLCPVHSPWIPVGPMWRN